MKKTKKICLPICCLVFVAGMASADVDVSFLLKPTIGSSNIGGLPDSNANVTITTNAVGNDLVYSMQRSGLDLDGGGVNNDTLSWDLRFEVFEGSALPGGQISVGANQVQAVVDDTYGFAWETGGTLQWWNRDTLRFSVENISLTADAGYSASFNGFDGMWLTAGTYYIGEGAGTFTNVVPGNITTSFTPQETLLITSWANERNRDLTGGFTVIPEPATLGLITAFGGGILFIRRLLQM